MRKVVIGGDPNATSLQEVIRKHLKELEVEFEDYMSDDTIYTHVAFDVAEAVARGECEGDFLLCGTGLGMCIAANEVYRAYAAMCSNVYLAKHSRESCNVNILTLGACVFGPE